MSFDSIDILHSDEEEEYTLQDIDLICKYDIGGIDDVRDIDRFIMENTKKNEKKTYESFEQEDIVKDIVIGSDTIEKYELSVKTETPINFVYRGDDKYYSIRDELKNKENMQELYEKSYKKYRTKLNDFIFAYYFSNSEKSDSFFIEQLNKLTTLTDEEYDEQDFVEKRKYLNNLFEIRMRITKNKYDKIIKFYRDLNEIKYSNSPSKINTSLTLETTGIEINILENNILLDIDLGAIFFNSLSASDTFPLIQLNLLEEKYYKIYEREIDFTYILNEKKRLFVVEEDSDMTQNNILLIMKLERITTVNYLLIKIDLDRSVIAFEYPTDSLNIVKKELNILSPTLIFKDEKIISTNGYFNINIENFDSFKFYYLTLFDPVVSKFIYINENKRPRSLKDNLKFYFKNYDDSNVYIDYSIYFYVNKIHSNNYEIKFHSKIVNQKNIVNEFALTISKLIYYYENYDFKSSNYSFIINEYTGPEGDGLGGKPPTGFGEDIFIPKNKKIDSLISEAPELFPRNEYARQCLCPKQPIIVDDEDIEDWEEYKRSVYVFPPLFSKQKSKRYNFVCPTENSIMNFIRNPDIQSPFPILPCCSQKQSNDYYRHYDDILKEGDKYWNIKEEEKVKMIQKKKTISILSTEQEGDIPEELTKFFKDIYPNHIGNFIRIGVMKNSRSSLIHCILKACDNIEYLIESTEDSKQKNIFEALNKIRKKYLTSPLTKKEVNVVEFRKQLDKFVNLEVAKQELYNYNVRQISDLLNNQKEIFDSKLLYRLLENIFYVNIFVFEFNNNTNQVKLEKPRARFYSQREIKPEMPVIFIFKHFGKQLPTYELIRSTSLLPDSDKQFLFGEKAVKHMQKYVDDKGYYICKYNMYENKFDVSKNFNSNVNWNYLLANYRMIEQFINDSGRAFGINFYISEKQIMTIFIPSSFPLNLPEGDTIHMSKTEDCFKIFGIKNYSIGSEGLWYKINEKEQAMFIPCDDVMTKDTDICFGYVILKHRKRNKNSFNRLNTVKRNTNILVQIILWLWNISEINTLNVWWENFVDLVDNRKELEILSANPFKIDLRFPDIENTTEGINFFGEYLPTIFYNSRINLYKELNERIYQHIKNYITRTEGYDKKIANKAIIGIFNSESDFDQKIFNKIIIGEKNYDDWQNFIENSNNDYSVLSDNLISQKRPFLYKDENGEIFIIQNNINNNLVVSLIICLVWRILRINLGYNTTEINIWKCIKCDSRLYDIFKIDEQKTIDLAKKYSSSNVRVKNFHHALEVLEKERVAFDLKEEDMNYYTKNSQNYINKDHVFANDPYILFAYNNGGLASILPVF